MSLGSPDKKTPPEIAHTENISSRGIRVITIGRWQRGERPVIRSLEGQFEWSACVVYCQRLEDGRFAIGLERCGPGLPH